METAKQFLEDDWIPFILREPDTFVGSCVRTTSNEYIYDITADKIRRQEMDACPAIKHLFVELLSNAQDSIYRSIESKLPVMGIEVQFNKHGEIIITNSSADIIPVCKNSKNVYIPEMVLGRLLSSSNYNMKNKKVIGKNGMGGTLANVFSIRFIVEVFDHVRKLYYCQKWKNNMTLDGEPVLYEWEPTTGHIRYMNGDDRILAKGCGSVRVTYQVDMARFGYGEMDDYPDDLIQYFIRLVLESSLTCKGVSVNVQYGDFHKKFKISDIAEYGNMYFQRVPSKSLRYVFRNSAGDTDVPVEAILYDTPDEGFQVSFVNGQLTVLGGVHVDEIMKPICSHVTKTIMETEKEDPKLNVYDLLNHVTLILFVRLPDPKFTSQTKERLSSPRPSIHWHTDLLKMINEWDLIENIREIIQVKKRRLLSKTDGKKVKFINIPKAEDANKAGTSESRLCTLLITEGDSAKNYALASLAYREGGRDYIGIYPLSGKIINVMNAGVDQVMENKQVREMKIMLGLQMGKKYETEEDYKTLRYGNVEIMTDQDGDGAHIKGLIMLFLSMDFPGILFRGALRSWLSPLVRAIRSKSNVQRFYTMYDFDKWYSKLSETERRKYKIRYYKGLGSSDRDEVKEDCENMRLITMTMDEQDREELKKAFDRNTVGFRKEQVMNRLINSVTEQDDDAHDSSEPPSTTLSVKRFVHTDLLDYTLLSINRAIPNLMDGLKVSERKILWYALKYLRGEMKTAQMANDTANQMNYLHNEDILAATISAMAQDFPGSNNLPHLLGRGQFGTLYRKKPSAGRYTHVSANWWLRYVYREEDDAVLPMITEEGKECEPEFCVPIIPMCLINGVCGIATSASTFIPAYNPADVVHELRCILQARLGEKENHHTLFPWYRGFRGNIDLIVENACIQPRQGVKHTDMNIGEVRHLCKDSNDVVGLQFTGNYICEKKNVRVTEIPVGFSGEKYKQLLDSWRVRKTISDYKNLCVDNNIDFLISGVEYPSYQSLNLVRRVSSRNQVLLTPLDGFCTDLKTTLVKGTNCKRYFPKKYSNVYEIMMTYVTSRLYYYQLRKNNIITYRETELKKHNYKLKFIELLINKKISLDMPLTRIEEIMTEEKIPTELLDSTSIKSVTREEREKLILKIKKMEDELREWINRPIEILWLEELQEFEDAYVRHYGKSSFRIRKDNIRVIEERNAISVNETYEDIEENSPSSSEV